MVYGLTAAVLYDSEDGSLSWQDTLDLLAQMPLIGLAAEAVDARRPLELSGYDLVIHPATTTHAQLTEEELLDQGIKSNTIRLSIGTEHIDDIIADLERGFAALN